jgi:hypothetical protein
MLMSRGFRLTLQLIATLATAAAVARATESARRAFTQAVDPPRHRALPGHVPATTTPSVPKHLGTIGPMSPAPSTPHPFGPALAVPCRGVELSTSSDVIELEASGELDGVPSPTERLLARRHAAEAS